MHVLQALSSSAFHGAEAMAAELTRQLHLLGATVDIAVLDNAGRGDQTIFDVVGHAAAGTHRLPSRSPFDHATVAGLQRIVHDRRIDVVHSHKYKTTFYAALARRRRPAPRLVTTYHNWLYQTRALRFYARLDKAMARFNDLCAGVSTPVVQELRRHLPAAKVRQIDNGIDTERYRPVIARADAKARLGLAPECPLVGFVGRLSPEKGVEHLVRALGQLPRNDVHAVIAGDGESRDTIEALMRAQGLTERVHLLGNRPDTPNIYAALDVFVLPSTVEAFPMVVLEAMAAGCPVVATDVGEVRRMVRHGMDGLVVPPSDAAALRDALSRLLGDASASVAMGRSGQQRVEANFSSRRMAQCYVHAYEQAMRHAA